MPIRIDLHGQRFERLVVLSRGPRMSGNAAWQVQCDCGSLLVVRQHSLRGGETKSCGCLHKELLRKKLTTHGYANKTAEYRAWRHAKERCENPQVTNYQNYGGRGIRMCDEWREDFSRFLADMGPKPSGMTLERTNNEEGYSPHNCIWASRTTQSRNRRNNFHVTYCGTRMTLSAACALANVPVGRTRHRIVKLGWACDDAITRPLRYSKN